MYGSYELTDFEYLYLKEGQIKHLQIKLDKEAVLQINITKKLLKGITPFSIYSLPGVSVKYSNSDDQNNYGYSALDGKYRTHYLHEGEVDVKIGVEGYPDKSVHIKIDQGQTITIDHIADFTVGTVIHGVVTDKNTKKPISFVQVFIQGVDSINTDENGEYYFSAFEMPGIYNINFSKGVRIMKEVNVNVNTITELNVEL
jgi:hypothetical protein